VLLSCHSGEWLEPMAIMCGAIFNRPIFHCNGNSISHGGIKRAAIMNGSLNACVHIAGQTLEHGVAAKSQRSKNIAGADIVDHG